MKKRIIFLTMVTLMAAMLSACGKDKAYLSGIKASDYVTLGEYLGIEVTQAEPSVTEETVDSYIEYVRSQKSVSTEVTGRAVEEGDTVNIDYAGYRDGVAFEGGTAQGQNLTIGSGQFIEGFEEGLIGKNIGDTVSLELSFPADYWNAELAGVPVIFEVTINSISVSEKPELNDEFVQSLAIEGCNTVGEYRDYVYDMFYQDAVSAYDNSVRNEIIENIMEDCVFNELPEEMIERYYNVLLDGTADTAAAYNMDLSTYMQTYFGMDADTYLEAFREDAILMAQRYIIFQAIADKEGLNPSKEEIVKAAEERAAAYGYDSVEDFQKVAGKGTVEEYTMANMVMDFLVENANIKSQ